MLVSNQVEKVRVGHDAHGPGLGWYLDELSVTVPSRDEQVVFPCHCWLAEDQGDGKLERELSSTQGKSCKNDLSAIPCEMKHQGIVLEWSQIFSIELL